MGIDTATGIDGATFELVNRGGENVLPAFEITDGVNTLISIRDNGAFGDMEVSGRVDCVNLAASGSVTLGDGLADEIVINGHIRQEDITFDDNSDGTALTLRFTDPTEPRIITFPEETGIVLTSTSAESALEIVGELTAGSIVPGFGSIVTTNNIETVGSGTITAGGQFTATSDIDCQGSVQLGNEAEDNIYVAGTVASDIIFAPDKGLLFKNAAEDKTTKITASFNPTSGDSPPGDRIITVPDLPSGGALHVVTKGTGQASNVGQITMHTSAGVIESNPGRLLDSGEEERLFLANRLVTEGARLPGSTTCTEPGTVVIVTIADYGSGGQLFVKAAKVGPDGQVTIVTQNIGGDPMTSPYQIAFALFN